MKEIDERVHLRQITVTHPAAEENKFPFSVPTIRSISNLTLDQPVTLFVGENGSGKSTLLEAIARAIGIITVGKESAAKDPTLAAVDPLVRNMKLVWNQKTHRGFFLRAEDFFGYIQHLRDLMYEMQEELLRVERDYEDRSEYAKSLAKGPAAASINGIQRRYGDDLDANSHGESFLTLFQTRFVPGGLYLLDEPEAALSPLRQLSLISMIKSMVPQNAQFIIATHSPILMAIPDAVILDFDQNPPAVTEYDNLEHVQLYRSFLKDPDAFIQRL